MNAVTSNTLGVDLHDTTRPLSVSIHRTALLKTFQEAAQRAAQTRKGILASFTQSIPASYATIRAFSAAMQTDLGTCFFWEHSTAHHALVGIGSATTIETQGNSRFIDAASLWRMYMRDAVITCDPETTVIYGSGPTFFGGFTFDPLRSRTPLWADFPDGLLTLPYLLLSYHEEQVALTINSIILPDTDSEHIVEAVLNDVHCLSLALEQTAGQKAGTEGIEIPLSIHDSRPVAEWMHVVAETAARIRQGLYEKVVLARSVEVTPTTPHTFDISDTLFRLRQSYPGAYVFAQQRGERFFIGATPERLVQAQDGQIQTMALAGSAPRGTSEEEDQRLGTELLHSEKNSLEHSIVVAKVHESLLEHCIEVHVSQEPRLLKLRNVQHLETPIVGNLLAGRCILDVIANLHPTPAVGGFPREAALTAIRATEQLDRGWYAGPVGWIGASGHGEFAVALRSGLVEASKATLFAGCGIVADSESQSEYAESCLKLQAMLRGLGGIEGKK